MASLEIFTVARLVPQDAEVLRQLRIAFVEGAPTAIRGNAGHIKTLPRNVWQSMARQLSASDEQAGFLAWVDGAPVGLAQVGHSARSLDAQITHLWVCREHRRKGVARALLSAAVHFAARHNPRATTLWVTAGNSRAEGLYQSAGFRCTGRTRPLEPGSECMQQELALVP